MTETNRQVIETKQTSMAAYAAPDGVRLGIAAPLQRRQIHVNKTTIDGPYGLSFFRERRVQFQEPHIII